MTIRIRTKAELPANCQVVFDALKAAKRPLSAYEIIEEVRDKGISAPPTVYRALTRLISEGLAHRLESLNAFVSCTHRHPHSNAAIFMICNDCGATNELSDSGVAERLAKKAAARKFVVKTTTIELRGHCEQCYENGAAP